MLFSFSGHKLGQAYSSMGKTKEASKILAEVYEGRKQALGEDNEETLETLALMGSKDKK